MTPDELAELDRYIAGELSAEEREAVRQRIQANPHLAAIVEVMRSSRYRSFAPGTSAPNVFDAWHSVSAQLGLDSPADRERPRAPLALISASSRRETSTGRLVGLAAAMALVAGASLWYWQTSRTTSRVATEAPATRAEYRTTRGERATVELRDGTRVILAPESDLRVTLVGRQLFLSGEAVFNVAHDPVHPLRVTTPNGTTVQDIGTQFDLRTYDKTVRVVVAEGSVSLRGSAQTVTLPSGTLGLVDSTGAMRVTRGVAADRYLAWADGRLTFTNARMADVLPDLRRWLDVDVQLGSQELADARLTLTLSDVPADVALDIIARALDARVVHTGQSVTLYPRASREGGH